MNIIKIYVDYLRLMDFRGVYGFLKSLQPMLLCSFMLAVVQENCLRTV